jgi:hypothetical protein
MPQVEPVDGPELDRLITALLNATGTVHQVIEDEKADGYTDGLEIIDRAAARLRNVLAIFAEHHGDEELVPVTEFLALTSVLVATDGGFEDVFYP